jgi:hypothetical protein
MPDRVCLRVRSALPVVDALCLLKSVEREAPLGLPKLLSTHPKLGADRARARARRRRSVLPLPGPASAGGPDWPDLRSDDDEDEPTTGGPEGAPRPGGE